MNISKVSVKQQPQLQVPEIKFKVVEQYPHDPEAVTEGLVLFNGELYESTGGDKNNPPLSTVRRVELKTGRPLETRPVNENYFAEGLTIFQERIYQLTDFSNLALIYPLKNLREPPKKLNYKGLKRGWGLTHDDRHLILSDSTEKIHFIDPDTFKIVRSIRVNDGTTAVAYLNELEYVNGYIYANLYLTDFVLRINPQDGRILGQIDLSITRPEEVKACPLSICTLNGIAHDQKSGNLFVTGKRWPTLFEISLLDIAMVSLRKTGISVNSNGSSKPRDSKIGVSTQKPKGASRMAKKKIQNPSQTKNGDVGPKQADPPVIVGGGGSVNVDFKTSPSTPSPMPNYARRHRVPERITRVLIFDGITSIIHDITVDPDKFSVNFKIN